MTRGGGYLGTLVGTDASHPNDGTARSRMHDRDAAPVRRRNLGVVEKVGQEL
jgi:hypothetical protein